METCAADYLIAGYSCSQSLFMAYSSRYDIPGETAARIAAGLAGGLGRQGGPCGVVTAAALVAGLAMENASARDRYANDYCAMVTQEFCRRFKARQTTLECKGILEKNQMDPQSPELKTDLRKSGLCLAIVKDAQDILDDLLTELL